MADASGRARGKHASERDAPERFPSEHERYLEALAQQRAGEEAPYLDGSVTDARDFKVEGNDTTDYVGVSPEYQTYSDEKNMPRRSDEGAFKAAEDFAFDPQNFPLGEGEERESNQITGSGSLTPHIVPSTSGSGVEHAKVTGEDQGTEAAPEESGADGEAPHLGGGEDANFSPSS